jgi:hypothetical protein
VNTETIASASTISDLLAPQLDRIIADLYDRLHDHDVSPRITSAASGAQDQTEAALARTISPQFGQEVCSHARRIALRHHEIGLGPLWYVAAYVHLKLAFIEVIMNSDLGPVTKRKLVRTLEKYVAIDMVLALSTYDAVVLS